MIQFSCAEACLQIVGFSVCHPPPPTHTHTSYSVSGGKLRGSLGKLPEFPVTFLLGMCLFADGYYVYSRLRGCLCKNHLGATIYGLLHPWWFGKFSLSFSLAPFLPSYILPAPINRWFKKIEEIIYTNENYKSSWIILMILCSALFKMTNVLCLTHSVHPNV